MPDVKFYELTEVMRQRGDPKFAVALNNYAVGRMTQEDVELLRGRETTIERVPRTARWLFYTNIEVHDARRRNDRLYGEVTTIHKALGSTFDECAVFLDWDTNRYATYVALSRVRSARNLYIVGGFHPSLDSDPASRILERLRQQPIATSHYRED
jgi:ATP-dependent exoDNAse (exonuclease V) alpha subunit